jgi:hypothetical protein
VALYVLCTGMTSHSPLLFEYCYAEDIIKINLKEIELWDFSQINLLWDRVQWRALVDTVRNLWVP